ncbi:MAG: 3-deoxy-manno-octulosonate cytidylyltransferase [bacterium]
MHVADSKAKSVLVIPARYASTRFPGKPLALIDGIPMIVRVLNQAKKVRRVSKIVVATDHDDIRSTVENAGGYVVMTSSDIATGTDRVAAAAADIDCDIVVNLQGDEPLINPDHITQAIEDLQSDPGADMATLACPVHDPADILNPNVVKVIIDASSYAVYFSRAPIPYTADAVPTDWKFYLRHIGLYVFKRSYLYKFVSLEQAWSEKVEKLEQLRALHHGGIIRVSLVDSMSPGVDKPEDIAIIEQLLRKQSER